jgi:hypothetical protein
MPHRIEDRARKLIEDGRAEGMGELEKVTDGSDP